MNPVMPYRYHTLETVLRGWARTGVPLVGSDGVRVWPEPLSDTVGPYYLVPLIARTLHLPLDRALVLFLGGIAGGGLVLGVLGCWLLFRSPLSRAAAVLALAGLTAASVYLWDVYLAASAAVVATVPLLLYFLRSGKGVPALAALLFGTGACLGAADHVRVGAGTAVLLFAGGTLLLHRELSRGARAALVAVLLAGAMVPHLFFRSVVAERDAYIARAAPAYRPPAVGNPMWHSLYIGLGYVPNRHGIEYRDEVAIARVRAVAPHAAYLSPEYTRVLRDEVLRLAREEPGFVLRACAAKAAKLLLYLAAFANVGLLLAPRYAPGWRVQLPFAAAVAFSSLQGMIAVPAPHYLLGAFAFATLWALLVIDRAVEQGVLRVLPVVGRVAG